MTTQTATSTYAIDQTHSTAEFAVKHMMVSTVKGVFRELEGTIHIDEDEPARSSVEATIRTASIDTGLPLRDDDLRSDNFFNAAQYPTMTFRSRAINRRSDELWHVEGDLTIRGITRPVILETELEGRVTLPEYGNQERIGFTATTAFNRKDFGLLYNAVLETGGFMVGDNVKVTLHIEAIRQPDEASA